MLILAGSILIFFNVMASRRRTVQSANVGMCGHGVPWPKCQKKDQINKSSHTLEDGHGTGLPHDAHMVPPGAHQITDQAAGGMRLVLSLIFLVLFLSRKKVQRKKCTVIGKKVERLFKDKIKAQGVDIN